MDNHNTFDEASAATQAMFEGEQMSIDDVQPTEDPSTEESSAEALPTAEEAPAQQPAAEAPATELEQAAQTAETAAQLAAEKDGQLQQAMAELEALKQQNQQLQGTIDEMSRQNTEEIIEEALTPPTLDINGLAFADEETQRAAMEKYANEMSEYNRKQIMKELSPEIEFAKRGRREAEKTQVIETLSSIPELAGIKDMLPQLDKIIANNKWLSSEDMPMDEKYINAFAMARGINSINTPPAQPEEPKAQTPEELLALYNNNPAFRELVEKQRLDTIKQSQQVPPFSASSGAVNAALDIKEKPKTLEEASRRTREMFGEA